jgi:hypothetical protein
MSVDSIGHRRLRLKPEFTFPEQAERFQREGHESIQGPVEPDELDVTWTPRSPDTGLRDMRPARTLCAHVPSAHGKGSSSTALLDALDCKYQLA